MGLEKERNTRIVETLYPADDVVTADFDVTEYGADTAGNKDSTCAIQKAIDDCYYSGGGTVWMPAGEYKVSGTIKVKAFVTLRGDWKDPDMAGQEYGTVVKAFLKSGDNGPSLFRIGGSAGVMGITVYYPDQNIKKPVPYNFTFEIPGRAWMGEENAMMSSVINCTLLNSYRGIGVSTMTNEKGLDARGGQVHETVTMKNIKGTVLYTGIEAYNGSDVGTWENIRFNNIYWAEAGERYNAQDISILNGWTRANGTALKLGDLEWDDFYKIECSHYNVGIHIVPGHRIAFCGQFIYSRFVNTNIALKADAKALDPRWGMSFLRSELSGSRAAVENSTSGYVKLTDCEIRGETRGIVHVSKPGTTPCFYSERTQKIKPSRHVLLDVTNPPYNAPCRSSRGPLLPEADAAGAIQAALDAAGKAGGGTVYLPAGWYRIDSNLKIPGNVELRGSSSVPARDQDTYSAGTVLFAYEGHDTANPETDTSFITLNGDNAGISGLRIFYPQNNAMEGLVPYPFTIRGRGSNIYIVNIGLSNAYNAVDLKTYRCDGHFVCKVAGCIVNEGIVVGKSSSGHIEGVLTNGNAICRVGYKVEGWIETDASDGANLFGRVIDSHTRQKETMIKVDGASCEFVLNCFAYGSRYGLHVISGKVHAFNIGTDNLHQDGCGIKAEGGDVTVCGYMRYNGRTSEGKADIYNEMHL